MSLSDAMALVQAHGRTASSFQSLAPELEHWFDERREACVAYSQAGSAWVAVGSGLAPQGDELRVMEEFARAARAKGKRPRFFAIEGELPANESFSVLKVGELPVWDPRDWPRSLSSRMRGQLRRDRKNARVSVRMATPEEIADSRSKVRGGIDALVAHWLDTRKLAPMGFMVQVDPWHLAHERRYFIAERGDQIVAALIAIPVYAREGWFLETMLRTPDAPNGSVELLFEHAIERFAAEGSSYLTFGICPLSETSSAPLRWLRRVGAGFYNFDGLRRFKAKLAPARWESVYLVYPKDDSALSAALDGGLAFLPGGLARFTWQTAIQRARETTRWMACMGMLWIIALACFASDDWFPSMGAKLLRLSLDTLTVGGLLALSYGVRKQRARLVAAFALSSFLATAMQLATSGVPAMHGLLASVLLGLGVGWPLLVALFLFACRNREHRYVPDLEAQAGALGRPWILDRSTAGDGEL